MCSFFCKSEDQTVQTGSRRFVIRNLRLSNYLIHVSVFSRHLSRRVTGTFCFARWGGVMAFSKIAQILISRRFLAVLDVPNCYGTSPLGPLVLGLGWGVLHGAKHSLPGLLDPKIGRKSQSPRNPLSPQEINTSDDADSESVDAKAWKLRFLGRPGSILDGKWSIFDTFRGFTNGYWTKRAAPVRNSESTYLNHSETTSLAPRRPGPSCYRDGVFSNGAKHSSSICPCFKLSGWGRSGIFGPGTVGQKFQL